MFGVRDGKEQAQTETERERDRERDRERERERRREREREKERERERERGTTTPRMRRTKTHVRLCSHIWAHIRAHIRPHTCEDTKAPRMRPRTRTRSDELRVESAVSTYMAQKAKQPVPCGVHDVCICRYRCMPNTCSVWGACPWVCVHTYARWYAYTRSSCHELLAVKKKKSNL